MEEWLKKLGEFDQIQPREAAERWGVSEQVAMERLHAMLGVCLIIPEGMIETYRVKLSPCAEKGILVSTTHRRNFYRCRKKKGVRS